MGFMADSCADSVEVRRRANPRFDGASAVNLKSGGLESLPAKPTAPARLVFTAEEMEERIARYRARAEKALPLFCTVSLDSGGDIEQEAKWQRQRLVTCHGCGLTDHRIRTTREAGWRSYPRKHQGQETPAQFFCPACPDGPPPYKGAQIRVIARPKYMITADRVLAYLREHGPTEEKALGQALGINPRATHGQLKSVNDCLISAGLVRVESQEKPRSRRRPDKNYTFPRLDRIWHLTEKGKQA